MYSPYMGQQQYLPVYGVPGTTNSAVFPYGQLSQNIPGGHGYTMLQGYAMPGHQIVQFADPGVNVMTDLSTSTSQSSFPTGIVILFCVESGL